MKEIFVDANIELPSEREQLELDDTNFSEWINIIRNDSTLVDVFDTQDLEDLDSQDLDSTMKCQEDYSDN